MVEHLWLMQADGSEAEAIEDDSDVNVDPSWLDAGRVVFSSDRGGDVSLWQRDLQTGELRQLTVGNHADLAAAPSPDGSRVAFVSTRGGREGLWVLTLEDKRTEPVATPGLDAAREPTWAEAVP